MSLHFLKLAPQFFLPVMHGIKLFEIRKTDRAFKVSDVIILEEFDTEKLVYTGRNVCVTILYILNHEEFPIGIQKGYCVMSIKHRSLPPEALNLLAKAGSTASSREITNV